MLGHILCRLLKILDLADQVLTVLIICVSSPHIAGKWVITSRDLIRFRFSLFVSKSISQAVLFKHAEVVESTFRNTLPHLLSSSNYQLFYVLPIHSSFFTSLFLPAYFYHSLCSCCYLPQVCLSLGKSSISFLSQLKHFYLLDSSLTSMMRSNLPTIVFPRK